MSDRHRNNTPLAPSHSNACGETEGAQEAALHNADSGPCILGGGRGASQVVTAASAVTAAPKDVIHSVDDDVDEEHPTLSEDSAHMPLPEP